MTIKITKQLATMEDLAIGTGTVVQERNGVPLTLTKINFALKSEVAIRVTSIAAMKTYSAPVGDVFSLNAGGRSGTFDVIAGNFSTELVADTLNGIYVALADDATGQFKVAKRQYSGHANIEWFGAIGDGSIDCTPMIQVAVDLSSSVLVPTGRFRCSNPGVFLNNNNSILGSGKGASVLYKTASTGISDEREPILREGRGFSSVSNIKIDSLSLEGNGTSSIPSNKGAGLFRVYECYGVILTNCEFYKSKGYGVGLQGAAPSSTTGKRGPQVDVSIKSCDFYDNGLIEYLLGSDSDDGLDCKSTDRFYMENSRAWNNGDKGFDVRSRKVTIIGSYSWENTGAGFATGIEGAETGATSAEDATAILTNCYAFDNGFDGFVTSPQSTPGVLNQEVYVTYIGCEAINNSNNFSLASQGTNDLALANLELNACRSLNPVAGTRGLNCSAPAKSVKITGGIYEGGTTTCVSVNTGDEGDFSVTGASFINIGGNAIRGSSADIGTLTVTGCVFNSISGRAVNGHSNCTVSGNTYKDVSASELVGFSGTNNRVYDKATNLRTESSASTITLADNADHFAVTGTTTINSIAASYIGRIVSFRFLDSLIVNDGGNLKLAGTFVTTSNDTLTLICEGATWYELSRSIN